MSLDDLVAAAPFSYTATRSGLVRIAYNGKTIKTLAGRDATRFLGRVEGANEEDRQLAMAKATGHFKHGTERATRRGRRGQ